MKKQGKSLSKREMFSMARQEHLGALGSSDNNEATMHEKNADMGRKRANGAK